MGINSKLSITGYAPLSVELFEGLGKKLSEINDSDSAARTKSLRAFLGKSSNNLTLGLIGFMNKSDEIASKVDQEVSEAVTAMVKGEKPRLESLADQASLEALEKLQKDLTLEAVATKVPVLKATGKPFTVSDAVDYKEAIKVVCNVYQEGMDSIKKNQQGINEETNEQITGAVSNILDIKKKGYLAQVELLNGLVKALNANATDADEIAKALASVAEETAVSATSKVKATSEEMADEAKKLNIKM